MNLLMKVWQNDRIIYHLYASADLFVFLTSYQKKLIPVCQIILNYFIGMNARIKYNNQLIRIIALLFLLVAISLVPYDILFDENNTVCIHHWLLGFECPLCGTTRAVYQFMHFQFTSAFDYNAVIALLPLYLATDVTTLYFQQKWLQTVKKSLVILITTAFLLLYSGRIYQHFHGI